MLTAPAIEALYTYDAYHQGFGPKVEALIDGLEGERWVVGEDVSSEDKRALMDDVRKRYLKKYRDRWWALLTDLRLRREGDTVAILDLLSDERDSPLLLLFRAVARETDLERRQEEQEEQAGRLKAAVDYLQRGTGRVGRLWEEVESIPSRSEQPPEHIVTERFQVIHDLVATEEGKVSALESFIADELGPLYRYMYNHAERTRRRDFPEQKSKEVEAVARAAKRLPVPLSGWLTELAQDSADRISGDMQVLLNRLWEAEVLPFCRQATRNRYPFYPTSRRGIPLKDFKDLFGPKGELARFFEKISFPVDTTTDPWRWKGEGKRGSKEALARFQRAAAIREAFFAAGSDPTVELQLTAVGMDGQAKQFLLDLEGQLVIFRHEAGRSWRLTWPGDGTGVRMAFIDLDDQEHNLPRQQGTWAWFRILDRSSLKRISAERYRVTFYIDNLHVTFDLNALSVRNPFRLTELHRFRCPERL